MSLYPSMNMNFSTLWIVIIEYVWMFTSVNNIINYKFLNVNIIYLCNNKKKTMTKLYSMLVCLDYKYKHFTYISYTYQYMFNVNTFIY